MKIYGVVGWKNTGKTGLMERLVSEIGGRGFSVSTVKHAHHAFDLDQPGKDSYRHRKAGAREVLLASHSRWALLHELGGAPEPPLAALLAKMAPCDLVLVEGYKRDNHAKLEVFRAEAGQIPLQPNDPTVRAVASDVKLDGITVPLFDLDDTRAIADFILAEVGLAAPVPRKLADACFRPPAGGKMATVAEAQGALRAQLAPVVGTETLPLDEAGGRVLAREARAARSNPPAANSAMDGYAFAHGSLGGDGSLALIEGRSAAGAPFRGVVPPGTALRILTGALLPEGADTVVMQEDVTVSPGRITLSRVPPHGDNTRQAGEDVAAGAVALPAGTILGPGELALLAAVGRAEVTLRRKLRVGVLSTGDELAAPGITLDPARTYDANRPMLLALAERWGHRPVDLGHVADDRAALRALFDEAAESCDVILTSGGASAGDEDHVSALMSGEGNLSLWKVALKPGKPLVLGQWRGVPVFGLPGNPVSAFVTACVFAHPSMALLAGAPWPEVQGFTVPASFSKTKRAGRRTFLRARIGVDGRAEIFRSESSAVISGLAWGTGFVELPEEEVSIVPGDPVRFVPFGSFGL